MKAATYPGPVPFNASCGVCHYCRTEVYGSCEDTNPNSEVASGVSGYSHSIGGYAGGQAAYVRDTSLRGDGPDEDPGRDEQDGCRKVVLPP